MSPSHSRCWCTVPVTPDPALVPVHTLSLVQMYVEPSPRKADKNGV